MTQRFPDQELNNLLKPLRDASPDPARIAQCKEEMAKELNRQSKTIKTRFLWAGELMRIAAAVIIGIFIGAEFIDSDSSQPLPAEEIGYAQTEVINGTHSYAYNDADVTIDYGY